MWRPFVRAGLAALAGLLCLFFGIETARAQACREIHVAFQPDCYRPDFGAPCNKPKTDMQLELGPQYSVWLTDETGTRFIDTIKVTNMTAKRGIGNRPGRWDFGSSPKFPYGRRVHVLPVWAHARGKLYPRVVMQDNQESDLGFHEFVSSPDPYYCRPMSLPEIDVDAISCPTAVFNSVKGAFFGPVPTEFYPPRSDLTTFTPRDCDEPGQQVDKCPRSSETYAAMADLDVVAEATPAYGKVHEIVWNASAAIPDGNYLIHVEINKEFDQSPRHTYPAHTDQRLPDSGLKNNIGQPSVVFSVPVRIGPEPWYAAAGLAVGYGEWDGGKGTLHPLDDTITVGPGSGQGRLLTVLSPWHPASEQRAGRVHVRTGGCDAMNACMPVPQAPTIPIGLNVTVVDAVTAEVTFLQANQDGVQVDGYELRYREGQAMSDADFPSAIPLPQVPPGVPGTAASVMLLGLKQSTRYVVGVRAMGRCNGLSALATFAFETPMMKFKQLEGCFLATASYGSAMEPHLASLRWARDRARGDRVGQAAVELYYRVSPPIADLISGIGPAKAVVRNLLAPVVGVANLLQGWNESP